MDELLAYAILLYEDIVTEAEYQERLDALFLEHLDDRLLLDLECETDIQKAVIYIRTRVDYGHLGLCPETFGRVLMEKLKDYYAHCTDLRRFGSKMRSLWKSLPESIQDMEPFWSLGYADAFPHWKDEAQTRSFCEMMLSYYKGDV